MKLVTSRVTCWVTAGGELVALATLLVDASHKRRARLLITNRSIPAQTRSLIRYALEIKDPYLAQVVRRVEAGGMTIEWLYVE